MRHGSRSLQQVVVDARSPVSPDQQRSESELRKQNRERGNDRKLITIPDHIDI